MRLRPGLAALLVLALGGGAAAPDARAQARAPDAVRLAAYGDDEGTCRRWNEPPAGGTGCEETPYRPGRWACPRGENPRLASLLAWLRSQAAAFHAVLHSGDFVRFDRDVGRYGAALGPLAGRFFPTTGGDQEFQAGRFRAFVERHAPHIRLGDRAGPGGPRCALCYHAYVKSPEMPLGVHVVSLENPDQYGDEKGFYKANCSPTHNLYSAPRGDAAAQQFAWLRETLEETARLRKEPGRARDAVVVLTHRPPPLRSAGTEDLRDLFARTGVDLVIAGDIHVYARGEAQGVHYFVTGVAGDFPTGCGTLLPRGYDECRPEVPGRRPAPECDRTACDHFLDIAITPDRITVRARLIDRLPADAAMEVVTWPRRR